MRFVFFLLISILTFNVSAQTVSYADTVRFLISQTPALSKTEAISWTDGSVQGRYQLEFTKLNEYGELTLAETSLAFGRNHWRSISFNLYDLKEAKGGYKVEISTVPFGGGIVEVIIRQGGGAIFVYQGDGSGDSTAFLIRFQDRARAERWLKAFENAVLTCPDSPF